MEILPRETPPLPPALAALPLWDIPPFGPLALGADVARAFRVGASAVRKMRAEGRFPQPAHKTPTASYYRVADLVAPYGRKFPGLSPDLPEGRADPATDPVTDPVKGRFPPVDARAELVAAVTEAVSRLTLREPESPAVIGALAAEMAAQRAEIEHLRAEVAGLAAELGAAREALRVESAWRDRPLLDRVFRT